MNTLATIFIKIDRTDSGFLQRFLYSLIDLVIVAAIIAVVWVLLDFLATYQAKLALPDPLIKLCAILVALAKVMLIIFAAIVVIDFLMSLGNRGFINFYP